MDENDIHSPLMSTPKRRTAAELMRDKQEEYDKRVPQEENPADKVHQHNSGYPKLIDELENRRSLANIRMTKHNQLACDNKHFDPKCRACCRQRVLADLQRYDIRPRCESGDRKEVVEASKATRAMKPERRIGRGICKSCREKERHRQRRKPLVVGSSDDVSCLFVHGKEAQYIKKHCGPVSKVNKNQFLRLLAAQESKEGDTEKDIKIEKDRSNTTINSDESRSSCTESMNGEPMVEN